MDFPEVRDLICSYDFFGVAETMCSEISFIKFGDYEVISFPATKKAIQGRSSGGFLLFYKKSFSKHTTILKQKQNYCVWFKFSPTSSAILWDWFIFHRKHQTPLKTNLILNKFLI